MNLSTTPQADLFVDFFDTYEDEKAQEILSAAHKAIAKVELQLTAEHNEVLRLEGMRFVADTEKRDAENLCASRTIELNAEKERHEQTLRQLTEANSMIVKACGGTAHTAMLELTELKRKYAKLDQCRDELADETDLQRKKIEELEGRYGVALTAHDACNEELGNTLRLLDEAEMDLNRYRVFHGFAELMTLQEKRKKQHETK